MTMIMIIIATSCYVVAMIGVTGVTDGQTYLCL